MFLLIGEVLNKLINLAQQKGIIGGLNFPFRNNPIFYFQYADDTIMFIKNDEHTIRNITKIMLQFQIITGLSINFNKVKCTMTQMTVQL